MNNSDVVPHCGRLKGTVRVDDNDLRFLRRCVELAADALQQGDEPFGSVLVDANGRLLHEDRNRVASGDKTRHPEFALARWAAENLSPAERAVATVYTSGEHCPMCAAAHAWVGLGRIVYASSSQQLTQWLNDFGAPPSPVRSLPIREVAPAVVVDGPVDELAQQVRELHRRLHSGPGWIPAALRVSRSRVEGSGRKRNTQGMDRRAGFLPEGVAISEATPKQVDDAVAAYEREYLSQDEDEVHKEK